MQRGTREFRLCLPGADWTPAAPSNRPAQDGDVAELQRTDEVVHGLAGKRLGTEGTVGVDCVPVLSDDLDETDDLLADHAVRGDCESRELMATRCLILPVLGDLGFGAILELLLDPEFIDLQKWT